MKKINRRIEWLVASCIFAGSIAGMIGISLMAGAKIFLPAIILGLILSIVVAINKLLLQEEIKKVATFPEEETPVETPEPQESCPPHSWVSDGGVFKCERTGCNITVGNNQ